MPGGWPRWLPMARSSCGWTGAARTISEVDQNVFAETGVRHRRVVVGAHLDSVPEAPGINDNGSGVAAVLQTAVRLAAARDDRSARPGHLRAVGGRGTGQCRLDLLRQPAQPTRERLATELYLNAEMIASPNYVLYVMRGTGTVTTPFDTYFQARDIGYEYLDVAAVGSDHHPFRDAGIPVGGLHCGSVGIKTEAEQRRFRGTAGQLHDPGYHQAADSVHNISPVALDLTTRALAYAVGWAVAG